MSLEALAHILGGETLQLADVGASYFLPDTWSYLLPLPTSRFVLFDPVGSNLAYAKNLPADRVTVVPAALSKNGGAAEFFLAHVDSGSSLLPPHPWPSRPPLNHDYFFPLKILDIETRTMAACFDEHRIDSVHAIKLDTQGSELDIVKGLDPDRLSRVLLVEMEVSMDSHPVQLGAVKLPEVISFFESHGFRYVNTRIARRSLDATGCMGPSFGATLAAQHECDVLFVKDIMDIEHANERSFMSTLRRLTTLLCAYYLHGDALETLFAAAQAVPQAQADITALQAWVRQFAAFQSAHLSAGAQSWWHRDQT